MSHLSRIWITRGSSILLFIAGLIHLLITPQQWKQAPAHGIFLGMIGVVEIIWAVTFWLKPTIRTAQGGVIIAFACITLWAITRFFPAPFGHGPEEVDAGGIITKLLEGLTALLLIVGIIQALPFRKNGYRAGRIVISCFFIAIFVGFGIFGVVRASETLFPWLRVSVIEQQEEHVDQPTPGAAAPENNQFPMKLPTP